MSTVSERKAELQAEITLINTALEHILKGGQSYTINTASGAGTSRTVTMADYEMLTKQRDKLRAELASLNKTRSVKISAGW